MKTEQLEGKVQTVLGLVDADQIGITTCHEHILWDMSQYFREPSSATDREMAREPVSPDNLWWVRAHAASNKDDICQTDEQLAVSECQRYKTAGGAPLWSLLRMAFAVTR